MNQAQLQSSLNLVRKQIRTKERNIANTKKAIGFFFNLADKDKPETLQSFKALNIARNFLRKENLRLKRLVVLSISLKKEIRRR